MTQSSFSLANQSGASYRAAVNTALQALASQNSGDSAPSTTYANQFWYDSANAQMKQRDPANTAWKIVADWDGSDWTLRTAETALGTAALVNTGTASGQVPLLTTGGVLAAARLPAMVGDGGSGGIKGAVPAPGSGDATKFLKGDGTWSAAGLFTAAFTSSGQTITAGGSLQFAHGLGAAPELIQLRLKCTTADLGYSVNDEVIMNNGMQDGPGAAQSGFGASVIPDATNINIRFGTGITLLRKDTGLLGQIDVSDWQLIVRAWR